MPSAVWTELQVANGALPEELAWLREAYPAVPEPLVRMLSEINGTYHQKYGTETIAIPILGSDLDAYPYYLKSTEQIIADKSLSYHQETIAQRYAEWIGDDEIIQVDEKIRLDVPMGEWLCFSDCINNGGTSSLYLDFSPTEAGKQGQVIRYLHDPDSFKVIVPDFGSYLEMIRGGSYAFTEIFEEDWE